MFTGIVETVGKVETLNKQEGNLVLEVSSAISRELKPEESVSHNGVCLTVTQVEGVKHRVVAVEETLKKSNLAELKIGDAINLERALKLNERLGGHLVQGHVDTVGTCTALEKKEGSTLFTIQFPRKFAALVIEKGSIALNGISLTVFNVTENRFTVAIIPYTIAHTNLSSLKKGETVNLEFDLIGKYALRRNELKTRKDSE